MHLTRLLVLLFLTVCYSSVLAQDPPGESGSTEFEDNNARTVLVPTSILIQPFSTTSDQPIQAMITASISTIETTFKSIITTRNHDTAIEDSEITVSPQVPQQSIQNRNVKDLFSCTTFMKNKATKRLCSFGRTFSITFSRNSKHKTTTTTTIIATKLSSTWVHSKKRRNSINLGLLSPLSPTPSSTTPPPPRTITTILIFAAPTRQSRENIVDIDLGPVENMAQSSYFSSGDSSATLTILTPSIVVTQKPTPISSGTPADIILCSTMYGRL